MGSVIVRVGCYHRLHRPITERTGEPCPACTIFGTQSGWPRYAWAMTVDLRPRLSEAATAAPAPIPPPPIKMPPEVSAVFATTRLIAERAAAAMEPMRRAISDAVQNVQITPGPMQMTFTHEPEANAYRVHVEQEHQMRMRRIAE